MNSLRVKIVVSLIGMSLLSFALGGYSARAILMDRFDTVVMVRSSDEFMRDALGYYRAHGSWEKANQTETFSDYRVRMSFPNPPSSQHPQGVSAPHFYAVDVNGKVRVPAGRITLDGKEYADVGPHSVGALVTQDELRDAVPIFDGDATIGYILAEGEMLLTDAEDQYLEIITNSWWVSLFLVSLVAFPIGILIGKRLADPINNLSKAIRAMRPETMYQKVPVTSSDELGMLSKSFNQMSEELVSFIEVTENQKEKIAETEDMRRQGLVSISHELRTPLNRAVSQANAMLDGIRALDRTEMKKVADSLDHFSNLVDDLYQLSLSDVQMLTCEIEPIDFSLIVRKDIEARADQFEVKGFDLSVSIPDHLEVAGDATRLRQIVDNLLVNCVRYSNQNAAIMIELVKSDQYAELVVSDNGPGVTPESLGALFDRFYRADPSRSRATGGTGLGLSLVKTYAEIHDGEVEAFHSDQGGLGIRVRIPLVAKAS